MSFKVKTYKGELLSGKWIVSYKIDGIRCEYTENGWISKSGKDTLKGLKDIKGVIGTTYEYYDTDWNKSSSIRAIDFIPDDNCLYHLYPIIDPRLKICETLDIIESVADYYLKHAISKGYEGVMFRQGDKIYRHKPTETYDVEVLGVYEGLTGKNIGKLGGVVTSRGKVGGGWSDEERINYWTDSDSIMGKIIEVKCQCLTKTGKFRHGNKVRIRWDKE